MDTFVRWMRYRLFFVWIIIERLNELIVQLFFRRSKIEIIKIIKEYSFNNFFQFSCLDHSFSASVYKYFSEIIEEDKQFFKPFKFDPDSISKILNSKSYLMYGIKKDDELLGIFFLRLFFNKTAYLGFYVDSKLRGQGVGSAMIAAVTRV